MVCDKVPRPVINNLYHNRSVQILDAREQYKNYSKLDQLSEPHFSRP